MEILVSSRNDTSKNILFYSMRLTGDSSASGRPSRRAPTFGLAKADLITDCLFNHYRIRKDFMKQTIRTTMIIMIMRCSEIGVNNYHNIRAGSIAKRSRSLVCDRASLERDYIAYPTMKQVGKHMDSISKLPDNKPYTFFSSSSYQCAIV